MVLFVVGDGAIVSEFKDVKLPDDIIEMIMPLIDDKLGLTGRSFSPATIGLMSLEP